MFALIAGVGTLPLPPPPPPSLQYWQLWWAAAVGGPASAAAAAAAAASAAAAAAAPVIMTKDPVDLTPCPLGFTNLEGVNLRNERNIFILGRWGDKQSNCLAICSQSFQYALHPPAERRVGATGWGRLNEEMRQNRQLQPTSSCWLPSHALVARPRCRPRCCRLRPVHRLVGARLLQFVHSCQRPWTRQHR